MTKRKGGAWIKYKRSVAQFRGFEIGRQKIEDSSALVSEKALNCECVDGRLCATAGLEPFKRENGMELDVPSDLTNVREFFLLPQKNEAGDLVDTVGCITTTGKLYVFEEKFNGFALKYSFGKEMRVAVAYDSNSLPYLVLCGEAGVFTYTNQTGMQQAVFESVLPTVCVADGRVFYACEPYTLGFSAPFQRNAFEADMHGGGRVDLPQNTGKIVGLANMDGNVCVFFEYGVALIKVRGSAREFVVEKCAYDGGRIFGDSVGVCAKKAFFLARDGVYVLREKNAKRICEAITILPKHEGQRCYHGVGDGRYYLAFTDENEELRCLGIHAESERGFYVQAKNGLSDFGGVAVCKAEGKLACYRVGAQIPAGESATFETARLTLGTEQMKTIETIRLFASGAIRITVQSEMQTKIFHHVATDAFTEWKTHIKGTRFTFLFELMDASVRINGLELTYSVLKGVQD